VLSRYGPLVRLPLGRPSQVEGKQALVDYMAPLLTRAAFDQFDLETHQTVDPDVAVIEMTATGRVTDTGEPFEWPYVVVLTVRDGLIKRYRDYWVPNTILRTPAVREAAISSAEMIRAMPDRE
jgi:hypothetical protein